MISKLTKDGSNQDSNLDELKMKIKDLEEKNQEQSEIIQMYKDQKNMKVTIFNLIYCVCWKFIVGMGVGFKIWFK